MVTISDVAAHAGVSIATVSNVINKKDKVKPDTELKVINAIAELGYIPNSIAKSLKTSHSRTIGVIAEEITSFNTPRIIDGICECCENNKYAVNLCDLRTYSKNGFNPKTLLTALESLRASRVAGLIYVGANQRDVSDFDMPQGLPMLYAYCNSTANQHVVNYDDHNAAMLATDYLADMGHTKIGVICGSINQTFAHQRLLGFQTSLMNHSLTFNPVYVKIGEWSFETARQSALELLRLPDPPTALFAMNDVMACGVLSAAKELGFEVPRDLSIVGFDNRDCSAFSVPSITTISIPLQMIGRTSALTLIEMLQNDSGAPKPILRQSLKCELVVRDSVSRIEPAVV